MTNNLCLTTCHEKINEVLYSLKFFKITFTPSSQVAYWLTFLPENCDVPKSYLWLCMFNSDFKVKIPGGDERENKNTTKPEHTSDYMYSSGGWRWKTWWTKNRWRLYCIVWCYLGHKFRIATCMHQNYNIQVTSRRPVAQNCRFYEGFDPVMLRL